MLGKAIDIRFPDVDAARVRKAAMRLQYGGVGFYPGSNFVHVDVGSVRAWPRMSREQLTRLFRDGKTVHFPADGRPLPGYEYARAEIMSRGSKASAEAAQQRRSLWAGLFGERDSVTSAPASLPPETAAYVPLPPPRPPTPSQAHPASSPSEASHEADLASLRALFSRSPLAAWPENGPRAATARVTVQPVPASIVLNDWISAPPVAAVGWFAPEMEQAKSALRRALTARAKALQEQPTSAARASMQRPAPD
jgi:Bacterial protein of unknown function (DUF882)